ncbi:MAG: hypothetical protein IAE78_13805 [Myxococcus sp.]|nr:hypothetical protein [Myxococcus sp.]
MRHLPFLLGVALGFTAAVLPACGAPACTATSCPLGCCDRSGRCQSSSTSTCGVNGGACQACGLSQTCVSGACMSGGSGAGVGGGPGGGASGGGTGGGSPSGSYGAFLDGYAAAYCQKSIQCGGLPGAMQADCVGVIRALYATVGISFGAQGVVTERSVASGASTFDSAKGQRCLTALANLTCASGQLRGPTFECEGLTAPAAAPGGACFSPADCTDGTLTCNGAACARTCSAGGNLGESCKADRTCNTPFICVSNVCRNEPPVGAACSGFDSCGPRQECRNNQCVALPGVGAPCPDYRCAPGAYCTGSPSFSCRAQKPLGSSCVTSAECLNEGLCTAAGLCAARGGVGAVCRFQSDCQSPLPCVFGRCAARGASGARCEETYHCADRLDCDDVLRICRSATSTQATGQACSSTQACTTETDICKNKRVTTDGGTGTPGTCGPTQAGDPCRGHEECGPAFFCSTPSQTCQPAGPATGCDGDRNCRATDYCTSTNVCATKAAAGQPCDSTRSSSCAATGELCRMEGNTPARCQRTPALGEPCSSLCAFPSACVGGTCVAAGRVGQPCMSNSPIGCLNGECLLPDGGIGSGGGSSSGSSGTCVAPRADGSPCSFDPACQSGFCDRPGFVFSGFGVCVAACR